MLNEIMLSKEKITDGEFECGGTGQENKEHEATSL
jgi:hypothetical protein